MTNSNPNNSTFLSMLKGARQLRNMTQADVAEILGVSPSFYNMVERNNKRFPKNKLGLLVDTVVDMDYGRIISVYEGVSEQDFNGVEFDALVDLVSGAVKIGFGEHFIYINVSPEELEILKESFRLGY